MVRFVFVPFMSNLQIADDVLDRLYSWFPGLLSCEPPLFAVDMDSVQTNIVCFHLKDPRLNPAKFCARMALVGEGEEEALGQGIRVLLLPFFKRYIRAVWHHGISSEDTQLAIHKMRFVASQYSSRKEGSTPGKHEHCRELRKWFLALLTLGKVKSQITNNEPKSTTFWTKTIRRVIEEKTIYVFCVYEQHLKKSSIICYLFW